MFCAGQLLYFSGWFLNIDMLFPPQIVCVCGSQLKKTLCLQHPPFRLCRLAVIRWSPVPLCLGGRIDYACWIDRSRETNFCFVTRPGGRDGDVVLPLFSIFSVGDQLEVQVHTEDFKGCTGSGRSEWMRWKLIKSNQSLLFSSIQSTTNNKTKQILWHIVTGSRSYVWNKQIK